MEFWSAVAVLRRRWYVFAPTLLVFALLAAFLVGSVKPVYKASGTMILLQTGADSGAGSTPTTASGGASTTVTTADPVVEAGNPYLQMDKIQFANVMAQLAIDSNFKDQMVADGGTSSYEVIPPYGNSPVLTLSATAPTQEAAMTSYRQLVDHLRQMVIDRQNEVNASPASLYTGVELNKPTAAFPQNGARTKGVIVVAMIGFLVAVGLSFLVDSVLAARRKPEDPPGELVSLIPNPRTPLDELSDMENLDLGDRPGPRAEGSGGQMRW